MTKQDKFNKQLIVCVLTIIFMQTVIYAQDIEKSANRTNLEMKKTSRFAKADMFIGGNLSFGDLQGENDFIVANVDLINVDKSNLNLSFVGGYFLNPLLSTGLRGSYARGNSDQTMEADFLNLAFNATTYKTQTLKDKFEVHGFVRNYIPMGSNGNFYIFSESSLYFFSGTVYQRATRNPGMSDENISTIFSNAMGVGAGVSLGTTFFSSDKFAFELQLGTTGLELTWKNIEKERVEEGFSRKVTFRNGLSFLNIQMGFTYYLSPFKKR